MTAPLIQPATTCPLLYYVPEGGTVPGYLGGSVAQKFPSDGPDGKAGRLVSILPGSLEYLPAVQKWIPMDGNAAWLGFQPLETPLAPSLFARPTMHPGHAARLGDGQDWIVPVARLAAGGTLLPRRRAFAADGTVTWQVEERFRGLCDFAGLAWDANRGNAVELDDAELDRWCGEALSINYRLHWREAVALGLFTDSALRAIVSALIDWPTVESLLDAQKKTAGG